MRATGGGYVVAVGDYCVDLILTGDVRPRFGQAEQILDDGSLEIGGSAGIFTSQMAKLGARVKALGVVGDDPFGKMVMDALSGSGVDVSLLKFHDTLKTGIGIALSEPDDRAILTYLGTIDAMRPDDLDETMLRLCRHFHLCSYYLLDAMRPSWREWLALCRDRGITTSFDTNWDPANQWTGVDELLINVDVFLPNDREALAISRQRNVDDAGEMLAQYGSLVVIKRGAEGASAFHRGKRWDIAPNAELGLPSRVVDTTGAGDNFDAGFLCGWLTGWDILSCMELGHRCAVGSLEQRGGVRGQRIERIAEFQLAEERL
ncbi:Ribokinase [Acidisarcina polymorpha]|uniref:Ribokinase n=1 Tax=Acidisarcina polymorpha TaxID=2211140 RepID=A0A2Z5G440_9BACT|nr:sugar kinase [Acidisarcina polymorpha]AXC13902.1 Ribokinase [Acidisarcina polymorpha]